MSADNREDILRDPNFRQLVRTRRTYAWVLSLIMMAVYFGYIYLVAYERAFLAQKVGGGTTSLGILIGLGVILTAVVLTGIYVAVANARFDALTRALRKDLPQ